MKQSTELPAALGRGLDHSRNPRMSDLVTDRLKEEILDGKLGAGDPIVVAKVAQQLKVSRQPVMEALKRMEADGIVEIVPQVGCRIARPVAGEVEDFFQMFAAMEAEVGAMAAARCTDDEGHALARLLSEVLGAIEGRRSVNSRLLNRTFHGAIHEMAKTPEVARLSSALWDRSDFYIKTAFGAFNISPRVRDAYARIGKAIMAGDTEAARLALRQHLLASGKAAAKRLRAAGAH
jgi:DNA-binding GntR family transcriptional regulator